MTAADLPQGYRPDMAGLDDVAAIAAVEERASALFAEHGYPALATTEANPEHFERLCKECDVHVVREPDGGIVGFAAVCDEGALRYLRELGVDPRHGRRGIGTALLAAIVAEAHALGRAGVALSTFRDVPFNAPFYARHGFRELDPTAAPPGLATRFASEVPPGVDTSRRVLMMRIP